MLIYFLLFCFKLLFFFFFVYIIFAVLFGFTNDNVYDSTYFPEILLLFHCVALGNLIAIHVFTYLPLSNLLKFQQHGLPFISKTIQKSQKDVMMNLQTKSKSLNLQDILKSQYGFSVFMKHLAHEFSTEVLLSVTEFSMWKKYLYDSVSNMVGFADRNQIMNVEIAQEDNETNNNNNKNRKKQSDIYSDDAPYLVLPFDKLPKS
eukprot:350328_1